TTTAILFVLFAGYLALRRLFDDPLRRATITAAVAIVAFVDVPLVHWSVTWWESLHQGPTVARLGKPALDGSMLATLLVNALAASLVAGWLVMRRIRLARLGATAEDRVLRERLAAASPLVPIPPRELRG
ncbi:MAG: cytochrome c biogenesis protein CcsA, partial [Solirubrobacterales bacterium]